MLRLSLNPIFDSYFLVAAVAIALLALLWLGPGRSRVGRRHAVLLTLLRAALIVLLMLAMLRPTLIYTQIKKQPATLVVLVDQSRSMTVRDAIGDKTRWDALRDSVADSATALAKVQRDFEIKAYGFDSDLHELAVESGQIALPNEPDGRQTAIGAAIQKATDAAVGKRLLGMILLSDGAQRAYAPYDLPPQTAAARLKHLGCRLYTFPFGQTRGLGEAKDVAVRDLIVPPSVFMKNELPITAQVRVDGYVNVAIPVRVWFETAPGKMEVVAQQTIEATSDGQPLPIQLSYAPQAPGEYKLTLEAAEQPGELTTTNNRLSTFVNVLKGGLKVLYLEGALRAEQKFLRRGLDASPDIKLDYVRIDLRNPKTRPADLADRMKSGKYDVYILGDLDSTAFRGSELADLARSVERGAGLIMLGGFQSFGAGGYGETPLANVLPVGMDRLERQRPDDPIRPDLHWPGPLAMHPTPLGVSHFCLALAGNRQQTAALWAKLPPLDGANKFHNLAQGAIVLADAGEDKPLLVAQNYGEGRVMAFAGDSTWRWWMRGYETAYKRFWRQVILWLARKDQSREGGVWIRLADYRVAPSQRVEMTTGANAPTGEPVPDADYAAEIVLPDGAKRPLPLARQGDLRTGVFRDTQQPGDYAVEVTATLGGKPLGTARARFLVFQQDLELDNATADSGTLTSLAAITDGESLAPEQLSELVNRLVADTRDLEIHQETKKTFWDTWPFFLMLVGLLATEWYLRKRWGLV